MIVIKGNDQLMKEEAAASMAQSELENKAKSDQAIIQSGLISLVRNRWDQALKAKRAIEQQMMKNIRQAMGVYEPEKLAAIKKMGGADVFIGITGTKCRHVLAWLDDILDQPGTKPWALEPTPVEELPADLTEEVNSRYVRGMMLSAMDEQNQTGVPMDMDKITSMIQSRLPTVQADVVQLVRDKAREKSDEMSRALDDQLVEGGWYQALMGCLFDLVIVKNGFIKGPITVMKIVRATDPSGKIIVKREAKKTWARANPFDIYPEPDSSGVQDGYLFHHVGYRRKDLIAMIGIDGYNELEIRAVLVEHANHGLRDWTGIESQRATLENKDTSAVYDSEIIDGLELYSSISGHTLLGYGLSPEQIPDPDMDYDTIVYLIGNHIIKATLNEDPYGHKPFSTAGYDDQPDSFWKKPLPEKIVDIQSICNATARGLVNNIGMGSGPQVEINIDRLSPAMKGDVNIVPWKKWLTTNKMMQSGKAIEFWQANMHAQELMDVFTRFSRVADEQSIPAFSHGDTQVGGAGKYRLGS